MNNHQSLTLLGLNVRHLREDLSLTQEALAERCDLDSTYISGIERGVRNPSVLSLTRLAKGLNTTISALCEGIDR